MSITEKVAYLKGLAEGMDLDTEKKEGKLLAAIIDVLEDIALELADLEDAQEELGEGLDAVSDDLEDVEDLLYGEEDEDEYELDDLEDDEDCYATTCPVCEETIYFDESVLEDGEVICPNCGEKLEFDRKSLEEEEEEEGE
ncbi:CD1247 N-terminal domain-containing protein [Oscillibacter sp.]|uniref:CD1247 N-terminal domain-containing protein n=1 Tax=Oscillibacter sp. TaxID=1945593 RepID=UPI002D7E82FB|nr:CD1247 N-terminal domain-containing protein [Oscillibacter sp.]